MVVEALLKGTLSLVCNVSDRGVFETVCRLHSAGLSYFHSQWRSQKRTIRDTEMTFKEVLHLLEKKPAKLLEELSKAEAARLEAADVGTMEFTDLEFCSSKAAAGATSAPSPRADSGAITAAISKQS